METVLFGIDPKPQGSQKWTDIANSYLPAAMGATTVDGAAGATLRNVIHIAEDSNACVALWRSRLLRHTARNCRDLSQPAVEEGLSAFNDLLVCPSKGKKH